MNEVVHEKQCLEDEESRAVDGRHKKRRERKILLDLIAEYKLVVSRKTASSE